MYVIPAIDILDRKVVRLREGDYSQVTSYQVSLEEMLEQLQSQGTDFVHIIDLNGAKGDFSNQDYLVKILKKSPMKIQYGGGIRSLEKVKELIDLGFDRLIIGTLALTQPDFLENLSKELCHKEKFSDNIVIAIDVLDEVIKYSGWMEASSTKAEADFSSSSWLDITAYLRKRSGRQVILDRNTAETRIHVELNLDGEGIHEIDTGLKFYDHMLDQLSRHSGMNLKLTVKGDLEIDEHHTIEDSAIALGMAMREAMGDKKGMERYGFLLPMDEALVQCAIDFSGRSWFIFSGKFDREYVGDFPTEMLEHWMKSFSDHAGLNLNLNILAGQNTHHKIEASFKALARCIRQAIAVTSEVLPTTKGVI